MKKILTALFFSLAFTANANYTAWQESVLPESQISYSKPYVVCITGSVFLVDTSTRQVIAQVWAEKVLTNGRVLDAQPVTCVVTQ